MEVAVAASPVCNEDTSVEQLKIPWIPSLLMMTFKALPHLKVPTIQAKAKYERHLKGSTGSKKTSFSNQTGNCCCSGAGERGWEVSDCFWVADFILSLYFYENCKFMKTFHFLWKLYFLWKLQNPSWIMILKMKQNKSHSLWYR